MRRARIGPGDWLVSSDGRPLNRNSAGHQWRTLRQAAGLDGYTLDDPRHFYAGGLIAAVLDSCGLCADRRVLISVTCEFTLNQR